MFGSQLTDSDVAVGSCVPSGTRTLVVVDVVNARSSILTRIRTTVVEVYIKQPTEVSNQIKWTIKVGAWSSGQ